MCAAEKMQFLLIVKSVLQRKSRLNQRIGQLLQSCIIFADTKIQSTIKQIFCGRDAAKNCEAGCQRTLQKQDAVHAFLGER